MRNSSKVEYTCVECGLSFLVYPCYARRGNVRFCSVSCGTRHRNLHNNPSWKPEVRAKISSNHADVSGEKNPMFGRNGEEAPGYIDGRNAIVGDTWRKIALTHKEHTCELC